MTGPGFIGWLPPPDSARPRVLPPRRGERLARGDAREGPWKQGWKERLGAWMARWIASTQWGRAHKHLEGHTCTHTHTERNSSCLVSPELSRLCFTDNHRHAHSAQRVPVDFQQRHAAVHRLKSAKPQCVIRMHRALDCFSLGMLIREPLLDADSAVLFPSPNRGRPSCGQSSSRAAREDRVDLTGCGGCSCQQNPLSACINRTFHHRSGLTTDSRDSVKNLVLITGCVCVCVFVCMFRVKRILHSLTAAMACRPS